MTAAPPPPLVRLSLGVTGHRETNHAYVAQRERVEAVLEAIFTRIDGLVAAETATIGPAAATRLHSLVASGADQAAAAAALRHGWELVAPLPFGHVLNLAINALPGSVQEAAALLRGEPGSDPDVAKRTQAIRNWYEQARLFELAEQDPVMTERFLAMLEEPADLARHQAFAAQCSDRVALAGRVMIEQSDIVMGIWDGAAHNLVGGTGHTIAAALELGTPVVWIDSARPEDWRILTRPESLTAPGEAAADHDAALAQLVRASLRPGEGGALRAGAEALGKEAWRARSIRVWTGYRRIEAVFGGDGHPLRSLVQTYEPPEAIGSGSGAALLAKARLLSAGDPDFPARIECEALHRFAWADGISARLSDAYRGGMIANFMLATLAVAVGIAYQPLGQEHGKWLFALGEFLLLSSILIVTWLARRWRWHKRWFETRRVAEYFRHAPILLLLGVARPPGRWPRGSETSWPEYYARHGLRGPGLPRIAITPAYLRGALDGLLDNHVVQQRDYHIAKTRRLTHVHHRLDRLSHRLFVLAVVSVASYLTLVAGAALGLIPEQWPDQSSKLFTFLGVMFPTLGASIAGMRYFGDFERFAAISEVTAEKLDGVHTRIELLLRAPEGQLDYASVSELAHAIDDIVIDEIENWQAVFGGKHFAVPV